MTTYTYSCGCQFDYIIKFKCGNYRKCPTCGKMPIKIDKIERACQDCGIDMVIIRPPHKPRISSGQTRCPECSKKFLRRYQETTAREHRKKRRAKLGVYRRKEGKQKVSVPQPMCTCCKQVPKDPDLRFLCRRCYSDNSELSDAAYWDRHHRVADEKLGAYS